MPLGCRRRPKQKVDKGEAAVKVQAAIRGKEVRSKVASATPTPPVATNASKMPPGKSTAAVLFYGTEWDKDVYIGNGEGIGFVVVASGSKSVTDVVPSTKLRTEPDPKAPEVPLTEAYKGALANSTRVRVDWVREMSDEQIGPGLRLRAHVCQVEGNKKVSGWLAAKRLSCEDGICGFCRNCTDALSICARLPSVLIEAERQQKLATETVQAELIELRAKLVVAETALKTQKEEKTQVVNNYVESQKDILRRLSLEVQLQQAQKEAAAATIREQVLLESVEGQKILQLENRIYEQRQALEAHQVDQQKAKVFDNMDIRLSHLSRKLKDFAKRHAL